MTLYTPAPGSQAEWFDFAVGTDIWDRYILASTRLEEAYGAGKLSEANYLLLRAKLDTGREKDPPDEDIPMAVFADATRAITGPGYVEQASTWVGEQADQLSEGVEGAYQRAVDAGKEALDDVKDAAKSTADALTVPFWIIVGVLVVGVIGYTARALK